MAMASEGLEYYRSMLIGRSWYAEGLSWTVIQPAASPMTVEKVSRRLHAEPINLDEIRFPHDALAAAWAAVRGMLEALR